MNGKLIKQHLFLSGFKKKCNIVNVFTVTFDQFNSCLFNKRID